MKPNEMGTSPVFSVEMPILSMPAADGEEHVREVADIAEDRTEYVAVDMRVFRIGVQLFVVFIEVGFGAFFVREHFYHLLPFHHFFHEAFFAAERALLRHHVFG